MNKKIFAIVLALCMVLTMIPAAAFAASGNGPANNPFTVEWQGEKISEGIIEIQEGGLESLEIFYNGQNPTEDVTIQWIPDDTGVCNVGVSPDGRYMEILLSGNAKEDDIGTARLLCDDNGKKFEINLTVKVTPALKLRYENVTVKSGETISGEKSIVAEVLLGNEVIKDFSFGVEGSAVCYLKRNPDNKLEIMTLGNGYTSFSVSYTDPAGKEHWGRFTWHGTGIDDKSQDARNVTLQLAEKTKQTGERFVLEKGEYTGKAFLNGVALKSEEYQLHLAEEGSGCGVTLNTDGTFTVKINENADTFYDLVFKKTTADGHEIAAVFGIQVQNPNAYILQFYRMEWLKDSQKWNNTGYATIGIFKRAKDKIYTKYIVTDEAMRRVDEDHFVNVQPEDIQVQVNIGNNIYVPVDKEHNPFTFQMTKDTDGTDIMEISYDRKKDRRGFAYRLFYVGSGDKYLDSDNGKDVTKNIFLWTRSAAELIEWNKFDRDHEHWRYDARRTSEEDFENDNDQCDIKNASVSIPNGIFGEGSDQINIVPNESSLELQTNLGIVTFDDKVMEQIKNTGEEVTLNIENIEEDDEAYQNVEESLKNAAKIVDLTLQAGDNTISQFGEGTATVSLEYQLQDTSKKPQVYYIDSEGAKKPVECKYDAASGEITFDTNHFSMYTVEENAKSSSGSSSSGGGSAVQPAGLDKVKTETEKALAEAASASKYDAAEQAEINRIIEASKAELKNAKTEAEVKAIEEAAKKEIEAVLTAEEKAEIAAIRSVGGSANNGSNDGMEFIAKSKLTKLKGKKAIRVYWNAPGETKLDGYQVYRSMKKNKFAGKAYFTTEKTSYINTKELKKEKTYYYKVRGFKEINGEIIYTGWSTKAYRTVK